MDVYFKAMRHLISLMGNTDGWSIVGPDTLRYSTDDKSFTVRIDESYDALDLFCYGHGFSMTLPPGMMAYFQPLKDALTSGKQGEVVMNLKVLDEFCDEASNFLADFS